MYFRKIPDSLLSKFRLKSPQEPKKETETALTEINANNKDFSEIIPINLDLYTDNYNIKSLYELWKRDYKIIEDELWSQYKVRKNKINNIITKS